MTAVGAALRREVPDLVLGISLMGHGAREPLGRLSLTEAARQAALFGRADGLVLTGKSFEESKLMLAEVRAAELDVPTLIGEGATAENLWQVRPLCEGAMVGPPFRRVSGWTRETLRSDWEGARIRAFMDAANP
jgi:predicted TIM-barrel enzyme